MRCRDAKDQPAAPRASHLARSTGDDGENNSYNCSPGLRQPDYLLENTPSRLYPSISTTRIMRAVEQQKRVSQQLEDLRVQQKRRTAFLRTSGLKLLAVLWSVCGVLAAAFVILLIVQPELLVRTLDVFSGGIAVLFVAEEEMKLGLSLIPSSSWLLSGAALVVVLMMGLWMRLMRYPREA